MTQSSSTDPAEQMHSLSRSVAEQHGPAVALVLKHLAHLIQHSPIEKDGRKQFFTTAEAVQTRLPYLSLSTVDKAMRDSVKAEFLLQANYNRHKWNRTRWFSLAADNVYELSRSDLVYFSAVEAERYGVLEAILLNNLRYWLRNKSETDPDKVWHPMSSATLETILPYSRSAISRALKRLVDARVLEWRQSGSVDRTREYRFRVQDDANPNASDNASIPILGMEEASSGMDVSISGMHGSFTGMHDSESGDNKT